MNATFRLRSTLCATVVALGAGMTGVAAAHHDNGNHCGWHHAKHTHAVGQTCAKHPRPGAHHGHSHH